MRPRIDRAAVQAEYRASAWAVRGFWRVTDADDRAACLRQSRRLYAMARGEVPRSEGDTTEQLVAWALLYRHASRGILPDWQTCQRWRMEAPRNV